MANSALPQLDVLRKNPGIHLPHHMCEAEFISSFH